MIRIVVFLVAAAVLAFGIAWFADRPGEVTITWLGYRVEMSLMVGLVAVAGLAAFIAIVWSVYRAILRSPDQVSLFFRHRRAMKGHFAITHGLIAVGAGDMRRAQRSADEAGRLSPEEPLTLLLGAQAAQMAGDRAGAERTFREMLRHRDTKLLGLRGLYIEAQRRNDTNDARLFAEEAVKTSPGAAWASQAMLEYRCAAADWAGALSALDAMKSSLPTAAYHRERAVLLTAQAVALEQSDRDNARSLALSAVKLAPGLVPAAALVGRLLAEAGSTRKAGKILETAWRAHPHPDIATAYANLRSGDSARERRARVKRLAEKMPDHIESALALAQAELEARDFSAARAALAKYLPAPTRRVAGLMAEIEEADGDIGRSREWLARATRAAPDPAWTADGVVSEHWLPVSPVTGRLDAFQWKLPVAEIGIERQPIEPDQLAQPAEKAPAPESVTVVSQDTTQEQESPKPPVRNVANKIEERPVGPVIPLIHAPDDPGPELASDLEPLPEPPPSSSGGAWDKIRQLFR